MMSIMRVKRKSSRRCCFSEPFLFFFIMGPCLMPGTSSGRLPPDGLIKNLLKLSFTNEPKDEKCVVML